MRRVTDKIVALLVANVIIGIIALAAGAISLYNFYVSLSELQRARVAAARDTCYIIRELRLASDGTFHETPAAALRILASVGLGDCDTFARRVERIP